MTTVLRLTVLVVACFCFYGVLSLPLHAWRADTVALREIETQLANQPKNGLSCEVCKLIVSGVRILLTQNKTEDEIDKFVLDLCVGMKIEQKYVCEHAIEEFGNELYFVIERSVLEPHELCGAFVKNCGTAENPFNQPWPLQIPANKPKVKPWPVPPTGKPTLRVLHLADIHVDRQYAVGSEADCTNGEAINTYAFCCRDYPPGRAESHPAGRAVSVPAGRWGASARCDIPFHTFDATLAHIAATEKLDYIILTGDLEPHAIWDYTQQTTAQNIRNITDTLLKYFPKIPIVQAVGNHEGVPMDSFAPHTIEEYETRGPQWLYTILNEAWGHWLPTSTKDTIQYRGSYSFHLFPGLKVISLNTVYCSMWNFYLYINATDPDLTLEWFSKELLDSEQKGELVHIVSHIPSGDTYCLKAWSANYYELVNRFENTIAAQFFGHTHKDHFYMYYDGADPKGRPTQTAFVAPSLTTYSDLNPAYRIYTIDGNYDGSTFTVLDEDNFWANLTVANEQDKLVFEHEYNKREAFGLKDMSPNSFNNLLQRMLKDDDLLSKYIRYYYRNDVQLAKCDKECRKKFICDAMTAEAGKEDIFCSGL